MIFVDTNYFLRFLLKDVGHQHDTVRKLFLEATEGRKRLITSTIVIFEIYWVLSSYYGKKRAAIASTLHDIIALDFIVLPEREIFQKSLEIFHSTTLSLEDCYNIVFARTRGATQFKTFDRKLAKQFKAH